MASKSDERLLQEMQEGRMITISETVIFPLFRKHLEQRINALCTKYRSGETNFLADVAQIAYIKDMVSELQRKQVKGNQANKELQHE